MDEFPDDYRVGQEVTVSSAEADTTPHSACKNIVTKSSVNIT